MPPYVAVYCPERLKPVCAKNGVQGFWRLPDWIDSLEAGDTYLRRAHGCRAPTDAEREAAWCGAQFGWDAASADPLWWEMKLSKGVTDACRD